jgi:GTP 3',8-cyclase
VDPLTVLPGPVTRFSNTRRAPLEPLLDAISADGRFTLVRQIVGYYYYVEVWRLAGVDVVFEEADLARLEDVKRADPSLVHELVFHPDGKLASTWQPWDGVLSTSGTTTHPTL